MSSTTSPVDSQHFGGPVNTPPSHLTMQSYDEYPTEKFKEQLETLSITKESIDRASQFVIENISVINDLFEVLLNRLRKSAFQKRLPFFYLVDSICQRCHAKKTTAYRQVVIDHIEEILPLILPDDNAETKKKNKEHIEKVLGIWEKNNIFDESLITKANSILDGTNIDNRLICPLLTEKEISKMLKKMDDDRREQKKKKYDITLGYHHPLEDFSELWSIYNKSLTSMTTTLGQDSPVVVATTQTPPLQGSDGSGHSGGNESGRGRGMHKSTRGPIDGGDQQTFDKFKKEFVHHHFTFDEMDLPLAWDVNVNNYDNNNNNINNNFNYNGNGIVNGDYNNNINNMEYISNDNNNNNNNMYHDPGFVYQQQQNQGMMMNNNNNHNNVDINQQSQQQQLQQHPDFYQQQQLYFDNNMRIFNRFNFGNNTSDNHHQHQHHQHQQQQQPLHHQQQQADNIVGDHRYEPSRTSEYDELRYYLSKIKDHKRYRQ
ncbi:hypothetical protein SAMD00019534_060480 [Acytostelium subglobosum LB1]|uniref:hypothetical protein n=1 Tax=Acytostelium subglobosum LB1 TaxID=1410327 RepID=UPI000644848D|nr:hypothetical protein SAMD00019534_060480 [Acytostelium subglobosum LB1]GAM22873.1 hypothetical protein SAMD00019534_060480 [Acytostelium subglobosum LB1]|eukprot:XP_012754100.1 hypothetical protein SAMD00019534_060480 [Acytostelium subglobosum LB1]